MKKILVVGSLSVDLTIETPRMPEQGETLKGESLELFCGGKGANQAVAIARLGGEVDMLGCVGSDPYGELILANLRENHVGSQQVTTIPNATSGTAHIFLIDHDNRIVIIPGTNDAVTPKLVTAQLTDKLAMYDLVIMQNEIPRLTNQRVIELCQQAEVPVLYNPAPADPQAGEWIDQIAYLTPNETECAMIFPNLSLEEAVAMYPNKLIVTLGSAGVLFHDGEKLQQISAYDVAVTDTTGAGDTFNGAFALGIVSGKSISEAITMANQAAAVSVTKKGAQGGMPTMAELESFDFR